jgi:hypothetical protein
MRNSILIFKKHLDAFSTSALREPTTLRPRHEGYAGWQWKRYTPRTSADGPLGSVDVSRLLVKSEQISPKRALRASASANYSSMPLGSADAHGSIVKDESLSSKRAVPARACGRHSVWVQHHGIDGRN